MQHQQSSQSMGRAESDHGGEGRSYLMFIAMVAVSMVVMYASNYIAVFELDHVQLWSPMFIFMVLLMGSSMAVVMLAFMLHMYKNRRLNLAVVVGSLLLFGLATWLTRSQAIVGDDAFMSGMIGHHSMAILSAERSPIEDVRVCQLTVEIAGSQRREIAEMEWLINDIGRNGLARSASEAAARPVPTFDEPVTRQCDMP